MARSFPMVRGLAVIGAASLALTACGGDEATTGASPKPTVAQGDGVLTFGTLLPQTGSLAFLGPPEFAGVDLAIKDINAAGGVLGKPVKKVDSDSGDTSTDTASLSVDRLLSQKVDAIVGAASSSVSLSVIDKITGAGVVQISPANTSPALTTYADKGLYFRTAPSDALQGRVLGNLVVEDGNTTAGILALQDAYGTGLADSTEKAITGAGGEVPKKIIYDPKAADYAAEVSQIKTANPDAIVLIGFDETKKIVPELIKQGLKGKKWYFVDGNLKNYTKDFPKGTLNGQKGTFPGQDPKKLAAALADFKKLLLSVNPKLEDFTYGPESYDATVIIALAAEAAKNDSGTALATKLNEVTKGGEKCNSFKQCKDLVAQGKDIDYDGVSGPLDFSDAGEPSAATIGIYQFGPDNNYKALEYREGKV